MMHRITSVFVRSPFKSGKSITQRKSQTSSSGSAFESRDKQTNRPKTSQAISHLSAAKKTNRPPRYSAWIATRLLRFTEKLHDRRFPFAVLNFDEGETFRACSFAISVSSSAWPMVIPAKPLALIAFTTPPASSAPRKTLKLLSRKVSPNRPVPCQSGDPVCRCHSDRGLRDM